MANTKKEELDIGYSYTNVARKLPGLSAQKGSPGLYALGFLVIGYVTGIVNRIIYKEDITLPLVVISTADLFYGLFVFAFGFMIRGRTSFLFYLRRIILPEVVYTAIIAIFLYRLILFIMLRLKGKGSENFIVKEHD